MSKTNKGGRPSKAIDLELVERMLKSGSSGADIAAYLGMNRDHFYRRIHQEKGMPFSDWQAQCKTHTRHNLRVSQIREALGYEYEKTETIYEERPDGSRLAVGVRVTKLHRPPNTAMLIFLGKNMLGQSDNPEKGGAFGNIPNYRLVGEGDEPDGDSNESGVTDQPAQD